MIRVRSLPFAMRVQLVLLCAGLCSSVALLRRLDSPNAGAAVEGTTDPGVPATVRLNASSLWAFRVPISANSRITIGLTTVLGRCNFFVSTQPPNCVGGNVSLKNIPTEGCQALDPANSVAVLQPCCYESITLVNDGTLFAGYQSALHIIVVNSAPAPSVCTLLYDYMNTGASISAVVVYFLFTLGVPVACAGCAVAVCCGLSLRRKRMARALQRARDARLARNVADLRELLSSGVLTGLPPTGEAQGQQGGSGSSSAGRGEPLQTPAVRFVGVPVDVRSWSDEARAAIPVAPLVGGSVERAHGRYSVSQAGGGSDPPAAATPAPALPASDAAALLERDGGGARGGARRSATLTSHASGRALLAEGGSAGWPPDPGLLGTPLPADEPRPQPSPDIVAPA